MPVSVLSSRWHATTDVLYIGKATSLRSRVGQLVRFGGGSPVGHWGGRYLWQVAGSAEFLVAWRAAADPGLMKSTSWRCSWSSTAPCRTRTSPDERRQSTGDTSVDAAWQRRRCRGLRRAPGGPGDRCSSRFGRGRPPAPAGRRVHRVRRPIELSDRAMLYCSPACRQIVELVRYARAALADGRAHDGPQDRGRVADAARAHPVRWLPRDRASGPRGNPGARSSARDGHWCVLCGIPRPRSTTSRATPTRRTTSAARAATATSAWPRGTTSL